MKQVVQNYQTGELNAAEIPMPQTRPSSVLVRTLYSAISAGTEKTKVDVAKMSLWQKARSRPDLVKKVLQKAKREGWFSTLQFVRKKLGEPIPLGYSLVGIVEEVGDWVDGIQVGDTVACAGAGFANHAEYNAVPHRLAVKVPPGTPLDQAAFTTLGAIALQGVRQADPKMGERFVVLGMGLLGQMTARLLKACGCFVLATDLDPWKLEQADKNDMETALGNDPHLEAKAEAWTRGRGADGVLITASTSANGLMEQAGLLCREKGRVVVVGNVGTQFPRDIYYQKELDIRLSRSYGPGRYDPFYEELGLDYPAGYVRFTEQRNMEAFLDLLASRRIDLTPLITHRFAFEKSEAAFALLNGTETPYLGILLEYKTPPRPPAPPKARLVAPAQTREPLQIGLIGMGNYAASQLLPNLKKIPAVRIEAIATASGLKGQATPEAVLHSETIGTIFIVTRHDSHAEYVVSGLRQNKNVFVEKPLCLSLEEFAAIREEYQNSKGLLCVGFNRRFAPQIQKIKSLFPDGAKHIIYRINAGKLKADHWLHIPEIGGGRLLGEGCHFIDLAGYLAASPIRKVFAIGFDQEFHVTLECANGALASILYLAAGDPSLEKEYLEVHGEGKSAVLDDFQKEKGQSGLLQAFIAACRQGDRKSAPIAAEAIWNTTLATLACRQSLGKGRPILVDA
ncbi:MAG: bi-domain-containing oxidoreductase [Deltaproteobacteria bacterium]|nr:bi-domain-containing oxidoreductase [Deltaproteobacteria bacterium]MBI4223338.1 bi-domain-containing oxidoreductase [Deltaproteobacteria bacterium]